MKAMIFAAGLGTRLRPLTNHKPKALVTVNETALLEIVIRRLKYFGCQDIIINIHHFGDLIEKFVQKHDNFGINITLSDERKQLLDTGGGLKKAAAFFDDGKAFLVCNTDILSTIDLRAMYESHIQSGALATLATRQRQTSRYLIFDQQNRLQGWLNNKTGEIRMPRCDSHQLQMHAFSGIQVLSPSIFDLMPEEDVFSIIDVYLNAAVLHNIMAYPHDTSLWLDVGKKESLEQATSILDVLELA